MKYHSYFLQQLHPEDKKKKKSSLNSFTLTFLDKNLQTLVFLMYIVMSVKETILLVLLKSYADRNQVFLCKTFRCLSL